MSENKTKIRFVECGVSFRMIWNIECFRFKKKTKYENNDKLIGKFLLKLQLTPPESIPIPYRLAPSRQAH